MLAAMMAMVVMQAPWDGLKPGDTARLYAPANAGVPVVRLWEADEDGKLEQFRPNWWAFATVVQRGRFDLLHDLMDQDRVIAGVDRTPVEIVAVHEAMTITFADGRAGTSRVPAVEIRIRPRAAAPADSTTFLVAATYLCEPARLDPATAESFPYLAVRSASGEGPFRSECRREHCRNRKEGLSLAEMSRRRATDERRRAQIAEKARREADRLAGRR